MGEVPGRLYVCGAPPPIRPTTETVHVNATIWVVQIVVALVCAFACYKIAESKNRNAALWAVLGFLFAIISLIIIALLKPAEPQGPAAPPSAEA